MHHQWWLYLNCSPGTYLSYKKRPRHQGPLTSTWTIPCPKLFCQQFPKKTVACLHFSGIFFSNLSFSLWFIVRDGCIIRYYVAGALHWLGLRWNCVCQSFHISQFIMWSSSISSSSSFGWPFFDYHNHHHHHHHCHCCDVCNSQSGERVGRWNPRARLVSCSLLPSQVFNFQHHHHHHHQNLFYHQHPKQTIDITTVHHWHHHQNHIWHTTGWKMDPHTQGTGNLRFAAGEDLECCHTYSIKTAKLFILPTDGF